MFYRVGGPNADNKSPINNQIVGDKFEDRWKSSAEKQNEGIRNVVQKRDPNFKSSLKPLRSGKLAEISLQLDRDLSDIDDHRSKSLSPDRNEENLVTSEEPSRTPKIFKEKEKKNPKMLEQKVVQRKPNTALMASKRTQNIEKEKQQPQRPAINARFLQLSNSKLQNFLNATTEENTLYSNSKSPNFRFNPHRLTQQFEQKIDQKMKKVMSAVRETNQRIDRVEKVVEHLTINMNSMLNFFKHIYPSNKTFRS